MKTSEMIAMLEENPKLKFTRSKCAFGYGGSLHLKKGKLCGENESDYPFVLDENNKPMDDWELVREPVTWQEAIQAWLDGKDIEIAECAGCSAFPNCILQEKFTVNIGTDNSHAGFSICRQQFKTAKWYIND